MRSGEKPEGKGWGRREATKECKAAASGASERAPSRERRRINSDEEEAERL